MRYNTKRHEAYVNKDKDERDFKLQVELGADANLRNGAKSEFLSYKEL